MSNEFSTFKNNISLVIAIPTLNSENTLRITMNSILNQEKSGIDIKVVLLDSGSEDKTKEIFFSYQDKLLLNFYDLGKCSIGEARNFAIKNLITDYLIFIDSDDAFTENRFLNDLEIINKNNNLDFLYGDALQINKSSFKDSYYCKSSKKADEFQFLNIPYNLSSLTIRRDFLLSKNIYFVEGKKGRLGEDWRFINEINYLGNYIYDPKSKVIINSRSDSHTQDFLRANLSIIKMEFLCSQFKKIRNKNNLNRTVVYALQIQSSLFLSFINVLLYTPRDIEIIKKNIILLFISYRKISIINIILNLFFVPISIYLILLVHRRSIFSSQRNSISYRKFKELKRILSF